MDGFSLEMTSNLFGNPHSGSSSSQYTTSRIEDVRLRLLQFFNADPAEFDLVFVANATAGAKLVLEAFRSLPDGYSYAYHRACHTSLVGIREEARQSACLEDSQVSDWIAGNAPFASNHGETDLNILFSYSAQSHLDGTRYPLSWSSDLRRSAASSSPPQTIYSLLDAASLVATSPLDLSDSEAAPDFTVLSLYKIFGFPDLGALIVRRQAEPIFRFRRYFGGGTVDTVACGKEQWHVPKSQSLHERLEDGTLPFHSLIALDVAIGTHSKLFGSMARISSHTSFLSRRMAQGLASLRHGNGRRVCKLYSRQHEAEQASLGSGPVVSCNIRNASGAWISPSDFEKLATLKDFHVRTGGVCSPGGIAAALDLQPWEIRRNFSSGFRCGTDQDVIAGKPTGVVRVSLGAMSTVSDVDRFIAFVDEFYRETESVVESPSPSPSLGLTAGRTGFQVRGITVYPIKSCAGYEIPIDMSWEVKPEGLAWDREWCLVHQGTGHALNQKRYPKMALIRPSLDFERGVLRVNYHGPKPRHVLDEVLVPLSAVPSVSGDQSSRRALSSRVCGDNISAQTCAVPEINEFFSAVLGVSCVLARFPAGGQGRSMRYAKAHVQKHQKWGQVGGEPESMPGSFPDLPSPPDSDSEQRKSKILLSNESPILLVNTASLDTLNQEIAAKGGDVVSMAAFRGNVIIGPAEGAGPEPARAYAEDEWTRLSIGPQNFVLMGACRRCQMVCVDQETGERRQEPFVTLAKTRRFDGKVYFGSHMRHDVRSGGASQVTQYPTIRVGDAVEAGVEM